MLKDEYLVRIQSELSFMTSDRYNEACAYFESCFDGEQSDEEVMSELGTPENAARNYYGGYVKSRMAPNGIKRLNAPKGLIIALVLVLLPVIVPVALSAAAGIFIIAGLAVSLIAVLPAAIISMWFGGAWMFMTAFTNPVILVDKLMQMGTGLALFGAGSILTALIALWYSHMFPAIIKGIVSLGQWLLKKFHVDDNKEEV